MASSLTMGQSTLPVVEDFHVLDDINHQVSPTTQSGPPSPTVGRPPNFEVVVPGIFRSSFPQPGNLEFLEHKDIKTILTLVDTAPSPQYADFILRKGIKHVVIPLATNKDSATNIVPAIMHRALEILRTEPKNILIHCNKGKHRTGCVVGCFQKLQGWPMSDVLNAYNHHAGQKARYWDEVYIRRFVVDAPAADLDDTVEAPLSAVTGASEFVFGRDDCQAESVDERVTAMAVAMAKEYLQGLERALLRG